MRPDFTHSFIRNQGTAYPQERPCPPRQEPVTSIFHFEYRDISPFSRTVEPFEDYWWIDTESQQGQNLLTFIAALKDQSGFGFWMFAKVEENQDERNFYLFISWKGQPPSIFLDSKALNPHDSHLFAVVGPALRSATELYHVPFERPMSRLGTSYNGLSIEMISWHIPSSLDPTFHQSYAEQFRSLNYIFEGLDVHSACVGPGYLVNCIRGWVMQPAKTAKEPVDKTHVFMLFWKSKEHELEYKDPQKRSYAEGSGGPGSVEDAPDIWKQWYLDFEEDWMRSGLSVRTLHLRFFHDED